ncbi:hypothetical protein MMC11_003658 [Xylographa trunciseda]|nr:hypothetical protein [Xylographa trunciseda]
MTDIMLFSQIGIGALNALLRIILQDWTSNDWSNRSALLSGAAVHNAHIRAIVPAANLLEFRVQEGWAPLCKFLGKEIPDEPFPRANVGKDSASRLKIAIAVRTAMIIAQAGKKWAIPIAVVVGGWWLMG